MTLFFSGLLAARIQDYDCAIFFASLDYGISGTRGMNSRLSLSCGTSPVSATDWHSAALTRRKFLIGVCGIGVAALLPIDSAWAAIANGNEAINKAGRLRMLSQRIAKAYCQVGQDILPNKAAARILPASQQLFRDHLVELRKP